MGINTKNNRVSSIYYQGYPIISVYIKNEKIWPEDIIDTIFSCYFNGYWIDEYPWTDDTSWTD